MVELWEVKASKSAYTRQLLLQEAYVHRALFVIAIIVLLEACGKPQATAGRGGPGGFQRPPTLVETSIVAPRTISDVIEAIGTAQANESLTLSAKVTDTVNKVKFEDGDYVEAGTVLAELTNTEDTALLAEAEANVEDARTALKRIQGLYDKRSIPVSQLDEARARFNGMRARYDSIVARLDDRLIRAPFAGLLGFRQVSAGTLITPGTPIATLDDIRSIKLDFSIPEVHLSLLKKGLALSASSSAYPDRTFPATVETINSRIDPVTRAAQVRALVNNDARLLKPGMLLTVRLRTASRENLAVPETALVQRQGRVFVYQLKEGNTASLHEVKLGGRYEGYAEVLEGLQEGEEVISAGVLKVRDNSPVKVL